MVLDYVPDRWQGSSLGLEYVFRLIELENHFFIFDYTTGKIFEGIVPHMLYKDAEGFGKFFDCEVDYRTSVRAMDRLYAINSVSQELDPIVREAIDVTA